MERIKLLKGSPVFGKFYIIAGAIFAALGLIVTANNLTDGFDIKFTGGDWSFVFFTFQGILFVIMGFSFLNRQKYFIEWDENEIRYLLPYTSTTEVIRVDEIKSADIKLFEIEVRLKEGSKKISLENLEYEDLKKIKEKFSAWITK